MTEEKEAQYKYSEWVMEERVVQIKDYEPHKIVRSITVRENDIEELERIVAEKKEQFAKEIEERVSAIEELMKEKELKELESKPVPQPRASGPVYRA